MATKRKMPVRTRPVKMDGEWAGWEAEIRENPPLGPFMDATDSIGKLAESSIEKDSKSIDPEMVRTLYDLLGLCLVKWNFVDEAGDALPLTREGLRRLPYELLIDLCTAIVQAITALPKASAAR